MIRKEVLPYEIKSLSGGGIRDSIYFLCRLHGDFSVKLTNFIHGGRRCNECSHASSDKFYVFIIYDVDNVVALKFGISYDIRRRLRVLQSTSTFKIECYAEYGFEDKKQARLLESSLKKSLVCGVLTKKEMPDGYTETTAVSNFDHIKTKAEQMGGIQYESNNQL